MRRRGENDLGYTFQKVLGFRASVLLLLQIEEDLFDDEAAETVTDEGDRPSSESRLAQENFEDIDGDGEKDLITGKRWWAHGPTGDLDPMAPAVLTWFSIKKTPGQLPQLIPHQVDDNSGIGTQFTVADVNGDKLLDIVTANKKGVFLFEQMRN